MHALFIPLVRTEWKVGLGLGGASRINLPALAVRKVSGRSDVF